MSTILIISDYLETIGGVEQYMINTQSILEKQGHKVYQIGMKLGGLIKYRPVRLVLFLLTPFNIVITAMMLYNIIVHKPDIIYRQNIHRCCGWLPPIVGWICKIKSCIMYHDLGYFCLYPSKITQETDIMLDFSIYNIITKYHYQGIQKIGAYCKYRYLRGLHLILQQCIAIHLVPSAYMIPYVNSIVQVPTNRIFILPHSIRGLY